MALAFVVVVVVVAWPVVASVGLVAWLEVASVVVVVASSFVVGPFGFVGGLVLDLHGVRLLGVVAFFFGRCFSCRSVVVVVA